ncbi:MAG: NAD(P)/FAD-dependent oxidoreductase [Nitrincola lacisaponensis]|uniref:NAD(P)/FAD-dependent oxidoreductase n=1 Tax=Nitrincola lacisaponensis TaxID=267850 RepID=UPI00391AD2C7
MSTQHFSGTVILGAGPSGLMAADILSRAGHPVRIYEAMPTPGRKFLMAGRGGLNITHSEAFDLFVQRYGARSQQLEPLLKRFGPQQVIEWMDRLNQPSFIGSSGRVFPTAMKAAPLLRAWLQRLNYQGVELLTRHRWRGWDEHQCLLIENAEGLQQLTANQVILATGGGSWRKLGSDGQWMPLLAQQGITTIPLQASNCGFVCQWSDHLRQHHAGSPLKGIRLHLNNELQQKGDLVITRYGLEGGLIYAFSAALRETLQQHGHADIWLDLHPDLSLEQLQARLEAPRGRRSLSNHLRRAGVAPIKAALIRDLQPECSFQDMAQLVHALKHCPLRLTGMRPIDEAISTAGGVCFDELTPELMLKRLPGVYCAGEMLDWDAPTGGYLLTACLSMGVHIAEAILKNTDAASQDLSIIPPLPRPTGTKQ